MNTPLRNEVIKVSKPLPKATHWVIRDINNSRVERVPIDEMPKNIKEMMRDVKSCHFMGVYTNYHWAISTTVVKGEEW